MKKLLLLSFSSILMGTACKKTYTCECTTNLVGITDGIIYDTMKYSEKVEDTKKEARKYCEGMKNTYRDVGLGVDFVKTCQLK